MKTNRKLLIAAYALLAVVAVGAVGPSVFAAVNRALPVGNSDGTSTQNPSRAGTYLEAYTIPLVAGPWAFADEGTLFVATNATTGTGIAGHAAPVVADTDTKALVHLYNGGTKRIYPLYLYLEVTAAGTAGTIHYTTVYVDQKNATARSSGGTQLTPVNVNSGSTASSGATIYAGAVVTAMTSSRKVGQQLVREVIPVVQDTIVMDFTPTGSMAHSSLATSGTGTNHSYQRFPPVVIAPGGNLNISQIRPSQSAAASYEVEFAYIER